MTDQTTFSLLVVQPDAECPVERFGPWLEERGAALTVVRPFAGDVVPSTVDADGLVVLGGDMGADDDIEHRWLTDVRALMRTAVDQEVPTIGICLGGQILATATGGSVARGEAGMESGVIEVSARRAAADDELLKNLDWPILQGSMHRDAVVALPPGSTWLAESADYPHQAFRVGTSAWGVQFHPELSPERYNRWAAYVREDEHTTARIRTGIAQFARCDTAVEAAARTLAHSFADLTLRRAATHAEARAERPDAWPTVVRTEQA
jgi:GMP synthase (glutamine-hydrolysing)